MNPFELEGHWFKANLHAHTTNSDGTLTAEEQARRYRKHRYHVLAITDHDVTGDDIPVSGDGMLVIRGVEINSPAVPDGEPYHLVCLDVPPGFRADGRTEVNEQIEIVKKVGGEVILAHPYWSGYNINHLWHLRGCIAMEVFNGTCAHAARGVSSVHWDDLLISGRLINAVASDDSHGEADSFTGWTMIRAKELTVASIMNALRRGSFYASCGPIIEEFSVEHGVARVQCSPAVEVHFVCQETVGCVVSAKPGRTITKAEFEAGGAAEYLRVEVVGASGRRAWTNPIICSRASVR